MSTLWAERVNSVKEGVKTVKVGFWIFHEMCISEFFWMYGSLIHGYDMSVTVNGRG